MRLRKIWARASRLRSGSRAERGLVKGRQEAGCSGLFGIKERSFLKRLVLGVTEAFGGFLSLGGVMIPLGGFWMFLGGSREGGFGTLFSSNVGLRH